MQSLCRPVVGKLTFAAGWRRVFVVFAAMLGTVGTAGEPEWQPTESIAAAAEAYLEKRVGTKRGTSVRAGSLDPRLRLANCDEPIEAFMRRGTRVGPRTIVGVRCNGQKPWKVYVPVDVVVTARVLTFKRTLPRGHVVSVDDIVTVEHDVSRMNSGYLTEPASLVGQRLKATVLAGRVITPAMVEADNIIRRGQTVTLVAGGRSIQIRMAGKALMDGAINQRIRVENLNSGRVVEGIVRSREHVEILLPGGGEIVTTEPKVPAAVADTRVSNNDR